MKAAEAIWPFCCVWQLMRICSSQSMRESTRCRCCDFMDSTSMETLMFWLAMCNLSPCGPWDRAGACHWEQAYSDSVSLFTEHVMFCSTELSMRQFCVTSAFSTSLRLVESAGNELSNVLEWSVDCVWLVIMESLSRSMSGLCMAHKRSFIDAFLEEEKGEDCASKKLTRMQLVRAKNRTHSASQNLQNMKERVQKMLERMCGQEAEFEAAKEDVERLKARLKDDDWRTCFFPAVAAKPNNSPRLSVCSPNLWRP